MNGILEPLLAILAIFVPLGLAYVFLSYQSRKPGGGGRNTSEIARNDLRKKMARLSGVDQ